MKVNLRYAIGEILIVIVGISIVFALNTWKDNKTNKELKSLYLSNITEEIKAEIDQLEKNTKDIEGIISSIKVIKPFLGQKEARRDTLIGRFFNIARLVNFSPENTTYQTLINSGDLKLIDNFELKSSIGRHYGDHKLIIQNYSRIEKIHERYLADLFIYELDFEKIRQGNTDFFDNPMLKNILISIENAYYMVLNSNKICLESNKSLLNKIETEDY